MTILQRDYDLVGDDCIQVHELLILDLLKFELVLQEVLRDVIEDH